MQRRVVADSIDESYQQGRAAVVLRRINFDTMHASRVDNCATMTPTPGNDEQQRPHLSRRLMATLALLVFSTAGTIHYQTPLLGQIGAEFQAGRPRPVPSRR